MAKREQESELFASTRPILSSGSSSGPSTRPCKSGPPSPSTSASVAASSRPSVSGTCLYRPNGPRNSWTQRSGSPSASTELRAKSVVAGGIVAVLNPLPGKA
jgi:hypothetical protein